MTTIDQAPTFFLTAGHPALDFVNTLDWRFHPGADGAQELLTSYRDLLEFLEQSQLLTATHTRQLRRATRDSAGEQVLKSCVELREAVAEILYAGLEAGKPPADALKTLSHFFKTALDPQQLQWNEGRLEWYWPQMEPRPELPLWILSLSAASLTISADMHRVRACENLECRWLFLDTSKNHTRRWCDMKVCGNRMKARRFKAQHKAVGAER